MQAMFNAEVAAACGPKGRHDADRTATQHGWEKGSVVLGGRRVPVTRPRARTVDGHEVPLSTYRLFAWPWSSSRLGSHHNLMCNGRQGDRPAGEIP
jgi:hypothetical protein